MATGDDKVQVQHECIFFLLSLPGNAGYTSYYSYKAFPSAPFRPDLKAVREGVATTLSGKEFQASTVLIEKNLLRASDIAKGRWILNR